MGVNLFYYEKNINKVYDIINIITTRSEKCVQFNNKDCKIALSLYTNSHFLYFVKKYR